MTIPERKHRNAAMTWGDRSRVDANWRSPLSVSWPSVSVVYNETWRTVCAAARPILERGTENLIIDAVHRWAR